MATQTGIAKSMSSTTLADLLERILDKGIVIAGDIRVSLVEVELLSIQIRLVVCSVDKAKEMGMDWWVNNPAFSARPRPALNGDQLGELEKRLAAMEAALPRQPAAVSKGIELPSLDEGGPPPQRASATGGDCSQIGRGASSMESV